MSTCSDYVQIYETGNVDHAVGRVVRIGGPLRYNIFTRNKAVKSDDAVKKKHDQVIVFTGTITREFFVRAVLCQQ
jgi:hypothetical protein